MDSLVSELSNSLHLLIKLHRRLVEHLRLEREAMVAMDVARINEFTFLKEELASDIHREENRRRQLSGALARKLGLAGDRARELIQSLPAVQADQIRSEITTLELLVEKSRVANRANNEFIEHSLKNIETIKNTILGVGQVPATYGPPGSPGAKAVPSGGGGSGGRLLSRQG